MSTPQPLEPATPRLSSSGQLIGWGVFGGLVLIGFILGVAIGYESGRPVLVAKGKNETPAASESRDSKPIEPRKDSLPRTGTPSPKANEPSEKTAPKNDSPDPDPGPPPPRKTEPEPKALSPVSFQKEVLPILRTHCLNCHGAGTGKPKADVNLTSIASMRRSPGKILVPGKPEESDVYTSITEREMPDGGRPKPTERELATLRNWILGGAKERRRNWRKHQSPAPG